MPYRMGDLADQSSYDPFAAEQFVNPAVDAMGRGLAQTVMAKGPAHQLPHFILSFTPDVLGQIYDVLGQFWSHPDMSPAEATRQFAAIVGSIPR